MLKRFVGGLIYIILILGAFALTTIKAYPYVLNLFATGAQAILFGLLLLIAGGVVSSFISIMLHELAHLLFGKIFSFKAISFKVLRFELIKTARLPKKLDDLQKKYRTISYGSCELISKKEEKLKKRLLIVTLSALVVSLLCAAAFLFLLLYLTSLSAYLFIFIAPMFLISFNILLSSAAPQDANGRLNDGALCLELIKNSNEATVTLALLQIQTKLYLGKTPSEIDKALYFDLPVLQDDNAIMQTLFFNRYLYYLDIGEFKSAAAVTNRLMENTDNLNYREGTILYLNVVFDLIIANEIIRAKAAYAIVEKDITDSITDLRVKAYYTHYVLKDKAQTESIISEIENSREILSGIKSMEKRLVAKLK